MARFDSPRGLEAAPDGTVYVADTNNHVVRVVNGSGHVFTLAGHVEPQEERPGCPPPCVKGVPGHRDGNLTYAEFYYPADVTLGYSQVTTLPCPPSAPTMPSARRCPRREVTPPCAHGLLALTDPRASMMP